MLERERGALAVAARGLAAEGLVLGSSGNLSVRADELIAISPTGADLATLGSDDITVVDRAGAPVHGLFAPSSELVMHLGIYDSDDAVAAVVHTHPPVATALSCVLEELPVVHYQQLLLGGAIRVAPYATFGSPELAELTVAALADRHAALMSGHGAVTVGPDLDAAVERARLLEWVCTVYWRAAAVGTPRALSADNQARAAATLESGYGIRRERDR